MDVEKNAVVCCLSSVLDGYGQEQLSCPGGVLVERIEECRVTRRVQEQSVAPYRKKRNQEMTRVRVRVTGSENIHRSAILVSPFLGHCPLF